MNETNPGLGTKEGALESKVILGYIRNSEIGGVLNCCGKNDLSSATDLRY